MNVHHLELFYYVAKHGGITPAVRSMPYGIQQPAVSGQMLQLEKSLGVQLFQRRPFALTAAGRDLYEFVIPFFSRLEEVAERLKGEAGHHLRLAASPSVLTMHLPSVLESMKSTIPDLQLTLREMMPAEIESLLASREVDVAITAQQEKPAPPVKMVELVRLPLLLLIPEGAPYGTLAALKKAARGGVIREPLITLPGRESLSQIFHQGLQHEGLSWPATMEVNTLELVHSYASHGFGYGVTVEVPMPAVPANVKVIRLTRMPPLVMGVSYAGQLSPVAKCFVDEARKYARGIGADRRGRSRLASE